MQKVSILMDLTRHTGKAPDYIDRTSPRGDEIFVSNTSDGFYLFFHEEGFYNVRARRFIEPDHLLLSFMKKQRRHLR